MRTLVFGYSEISSQSQSRDNLRQLACAARGMVVTVPTGGVGEKSLSQSVAYATDVHDRSIVRIARSRVCVFACLRVFELSCLRCSFVCFSSTFLDFMLSVPLTSKYRAVPFLL